MIAPQQICRNVAIRQPSQLAIEEEADRGVLPFAVENVARDHHERNVFFDGLRDQTFERAPARTGEASGDGVIFLRQAKEGAA